MAKKNNKRGVPVAAFITPGPARTMRDFATDQARRQIGKKSMNLSNWSKVGKALTSPTALKVAGAVAGYMGGTNSGSVNAGKDKIPYVEKESERRRFTGDGLQTGKIFKTTFETGIPTSKSIQTAAKLNGTTKFTLLDSLTASFYEAGIERDGLSSSTGFNQKRVSVLIDVGFRAKDFYDLYKLNTWTHPQRKIQRAYGLARYLESKVRIMNTGQFFRTKTKISLYSPTSVRNAASGAIAAIFPTVTEFDTNTQGDSIPLLKAFSAAGNVGQHYSGLADPATPITASADFARQYNLEHSFTKTLAPGDVWDFTMKTHLGSGIRLDVARDANFSDPQSLENYLIVFEQQGSLCEAVLQADESHSYIGLSPSFLQYEFSNSIDLVVNSNSSIGDTTTQGGFLSDRYAIKTFTEKPWSSAQKKINFDASEIGPKGSTAELFIPVMTDKNVNYAGERSVEN